MAVQLSSAGQMGLYSLQNIDRASSAPSWQKVRSLTVPFSIPTYLQATTYIATRPAPDDALPYSKVLYTKYLHHTA